MNDPPIGTSKDWHKKQTLNSKQTKQKLKRPRGGMSLGSGSKARALILYNIRAQSRLRLGPDSIKLDSFHL